MRIFVGDQELTSEVEGHAGAKGCRRYSWSFNECDTPLGCKAADEVDISGPVNLPDRAVLAHYDHPATKCALFVERNRAVVREGAPDLRKERDGTQQKIVPIDVLAFCDENVARCEPGRDGLPWSDSQVFFNALLIPKRDLPHHRGIPQAVERNEIVVAPFGRVKIRWGSGNPCGLEECAKE